MDNKKLQKLIDELVKAQIAALTATNNLDEYCLDNWGFTPSDRDVDEILDGVYGLCGIPSEMSAKEFIEAMKKAK